MKSDIFHSKQFDIKSISIPKFELKNGKLIRFYIPDTRIIGFDLTIELIKYFQTKNKNLPWAKHYDSSSMWRRIYPLTVKSYLVRKHKIDNQVAERIAAEIGIRLEDKLEHLNHINRKSLVIKALFEKNDFILIDYYGVDAIGIKKIEHIVNSEIEKGKKQLLLMFYNIWREKNHLKILKELY